jgi:hypothetical protein
MDLGFFVRSSFLGEFFHAIKPPIKRPQLQITDVKIFIQQNNYYYNIQCEIIVLNSQEREREMKPARKKPIVFSI